MSAFAKACTINIDAETRTQKFKKLALPNPSLASTSAAKKLATGGALRPIAGFATLAIKNFLDIVSSEALDKMSQRTGFSVETSRWVS